MYSNMQQMAQSAISCGESASLMNSIQGGGSGGIGLDRLADMCNAKVDVYSQLSAFQQCSRVYVCATLAYAHAIDNISTYGGDCTAAAGAALQIYKVQ
jgi:hypothetical protein